MKRALLVTTERYPDGDAGAVRTHALAKMLQSLGYEPTVVGMGESTGFAYREKEGVRYTSFRLSSSTLFSRIRGRLRFHGRLRRVLLSAGDGWDLIVVALVSGRTMKMLKRFSLAQSVPLLYDSVEWYSPEQFSLGRLHPEYIAMDRRNKRHASHPVRVIAISSFLEKHFSARGLLTARIPAVMDMRSIPFEKRTKADTTVFTYAGAPGKKDRLGVIVQGFASLADDALPPYELHLLGVTREALSALCDERALEKAEKHLVCHGRVAREEVLAQLARTDFTVLMRSERQRYAKAGFPTKFVESLATATPMIANATSDIAEYLHDGKNGFLVSDESASALADALRRAIRSSAAERAAMQNAARATAEDCFDLQKHLATLEALIEK